MAITEDSRHQLYKALEEQLGAHNATTLMEHLPPVGWADVATKRDLDATQVLMKRDLDAVEVVMKRDLDAVEHRMSLELERGLHRQTQVFVTWMIAMNAAMAAAIITAIKL